MTHSIKKRPLILITNDDGISAPGIKTLISVMKELGDIVVVAPDRPQSAMGHAITVNSTLFINKVTIGSSELGETYYTCTGTPVDCVKLGLHEILKCKPDLCVSGINHGSNSSINIIYSGTMGAAIESGIQGIPSIGFSLLDYSWNANFEDTKSFVKKITIRVLQEGLPKNIVLNVNFPKLSKREIKGIKICRQARAKWIEEFDKRQTPHGRDYYWLKGQFVNYDYERDTDEWALANGYISIVPIQFDLTAYEVINELNTWNLDE